MQINGSRYMIHLGDSAERLLMLGDDCVDALACDPPAGIGFMGKEWDHDHGHRDEWVRAFASTFRECLRVMKPGAHGLVWALPRTSHWTATALEDAGFEIRDVVMHVFGCVPTDTEILTANGWRLHGDLRVGDSVVQVDERGAASFGPLRAVSVYPFTGKMRRIVTRSTEQVLTPGHTVHAYARRAKWQRIETDDALTATTADAFCGGDHPGVSGWQLPLAARGAEVGSRTLESEDVASLYGWVITEGHFHGDVRAVSIYQNVGEKADEIRGILDRLAIPFSEYHRERTDYDGKLRPTAQFYLRVGEWPNRLRADLDAKLPPSWLAWLPVTQAMALFEALVSGDGSRNDGDESGAFYQKNPLTRAWFQSLCFRLGYRSSENSEKIMINWSRSDSTEVQRGTHRNRWSREMDYSGEVWCPTVPQGRWVARYRGCVFVTGNTGFPKSLNVEKAGAGPEWAGWGTALKPAAEHWILVRKPIEGTVAANVLAHGTGALNIDASRIGVGVAVPGGGNGKANHGGRFGGAGGTQGGRPRVEAHTNGRFPANVIFDEEAAKALDEQSGVSKDGVAMEPKGTPMKRSVYGKTGTLGRRVTFGGEGGASRFFYVSKAPKKDKGADNTHPTVKNTELMDYLIRMITPPGGTVLDPFMGSGSTGVAAVRGGFRFIGIDRERAYFETAHRRINEAERGRP